MATRHYSPKGFFRQMPNALLARYYFHERGVFGEPDFSAMKESKPDALFAAWLALPEAQHHAMDMEFQEIFGMSCEKGCRAIIDEAEWQLRGTPDAYAAFIEQLAALPNHYERAMATLSRPPLILERPARADSQADRSRDAYHHLPEEAPVLVVMSSGRDSVLKLCPNRRWRSRATD